MADNAEEAHTEAPLFEILIEREGRMFTPRSLQELGAWLEKERAFWAWLVEAKNEDQALDYVINSLHWPLERLMQMWNEANANPNNRQHILEQLRSELANHLTGRRTPTAETPMARYAEELARTDKVVAAHALWALMGNDPQGTSRPARALRGQVLATLHTAERDSLAPAAKAAWTKTQQRVNVEHEALRKEAGKISEDFRETSAEVATLHETQRDTFDQQQASRQTAFDKQMKEHAAEMARIEETFRRELSLRSAVQYLDTKAGGHKEVAKKAATAAAVVGTAFVAIAASVAYAVFKEDGAVPVPQLAVAVLTATLFFWVLRILVRVFLSNLHLETDMRARSTFVHTYLALLAEGGGIKDEDRALVIGLVFRPISDGLVKDDATPPGLWDLVTKNLSGRS